MDGALNMLETNRTLDFKQQLKVIYELGKVRISLPIALSAVTGYVLFQHVMDAHRITSYNVCYTKLLRPENR